MLAKIKLDLAVIRKAILELDDEKLSMDDLKAIGKQLPSIEEVTPSTPVARHLLTFVADDEAQRVRQCGQVVESRPVLQSSMSSPSSPSAMLILRRL